MPDMEYDHLKTRAKKKLFLFKILKVKQSSLKNISNNGLAKRQFIFQK